MCMFLKVLVQAVGLLNDQHRIRQRFYSRSWIANFQFTRLQVFQLHNENRPISSFYATKTFYSWCDFFGSNFITASFNCIIRRNASHCNLVNSCRRLVCMCVCMYVTLVDHTKTVWDKSTIFHHLVGNQSIQPRTYPATLLHMTLTYFLKVKDWNLYHLSRLNVFIS